MPRGRGRGRVAGRGKARGKAKAGPKARATARRASANERRDARRVALRSLNTLATEVGARAISVKRAKPTQVEGLVRLLQRRVGLGEQHERLRAAVNSWVDNGGEFSVPVEPAPETPEEHAPIARHRPLLAGFRLESKAFMLTYQNEALPEPMQVRTSPFAGRAGGHGQRVRVDQHPADRGTRQGRTQKGGHTASSPPCEGRGVTRTVSPPSG